MVMMNRGGSRENLKPVTEATRMPPDRSSALSSGRGPGLTDRSVLEEHGGYICAGCNRSWSSIRSLSHHRASPYMRGSECEKVGSGRELRNIYRANLATGQDSRCPVFSAGICEYNSIITPSNAPLHGRYVCRKGKITPHYFTNTAPLFRNVIRSNGNNGSNQ